MPRIKRVVYDVDEYVIMQNIRKRPLEKQKYLAPFALTLNKLLVERNIDQDQMAEDLDISTGALSGYRNGQGNPTLDVIYRIAEYLQVDCNYLITGVKAEHYKISSYTGLSDKAINYIHSLDDDGKQILNKLIEANISGVLDGIECAFRTIEMSRGIDSQKIKNDLLFDEKNRPFIKLSPKDTISYFVKNACDVASNIIEMVVADKKVSVVERKEGSISNGKKGK